MNAIPSEQLETSQEATDTNANLAAVNDVEAGIRDFVRSDVAYLRRPGQAPLNETPDNDAAVKNVNSLIQRVAGTSLGEIENLITELETLRDLLHVEGQRVQREIAGYAHLSHAAMKSTRIIAENLQQWKSSTETIRKS